MTSLCFKELERTYSKNSASVKTLFSGDEEDFRHNKPSLVWSWKCWSRFLKNLINHAVESLGYFLLLLHKIKKIGVQYKRVNMKRKERCAIPCETHHQLSVHNLSPGWMLLGAFTDANPSSLSSAGIYLRKIDSRLNCSNITIASYM